MAQTAELEAALDAWMKSGEYLPPILRDFHDQKDAFKAVDALVERAQQKPGNTLAGLSWRDAHIYTVDFFLWYMARRGYTLQRSRKRGVSFRDLSADVSAARRERDAQSASILHEAFALSRASSPACPDCRGSGRFDCEDERRSGVCPRCKGSGVSPSSGGEKP